MPFRVQAVKHFLTYSQCPLDKVFVIEFLKDLEPTASYICVSSEQHQDGNAHIHAYLHFKSKRDIKNETHFDIQFGDVTYHPNHKSANKNSLTYTKKDGDWVEHGDVPGKSSAWIESLGKRTADEAFEHILEHHPRDAFIFSNAIKSFLENRFAPSKQWTPEFQITSFSVPDLLMEWISNNVMVSYVRIRCAPLPPRGGTCACGAFLKVTLDSNPNL